MKKGDKVTMIKSWDERGTVAYYQAEVLSWGKIRATLIQESNTARRFCTPKVATNNEQGIYPRMTDEAAEAMCLIVGRNVAAERKAQWEKDIEQNSHNAFYVAAIQKQINELHEPKAIKKIF